MTSEDVGFNPDVLDPFPVTLSRSHLWKRRQDFGPVSSVVKLQVFTRLENDPLLDDGIGLVSRWPALNLQ